MPITISWYHGPFDQSTREIRALKYFEDHILEVTSDFSLQYPNTKFFHPQAVFHDNVDVFYGADDIKAMMKRVFGQFDNASMEPRYLQVIDESEGDIFKYTIIAELTVAYYLKGDPDSVLTPRLMVFTITNGADSEAYDGLNYTEVYLAWNVGIVKEEATRREKLFEKKSSSGTDQA